RRQGLLELRTPERMRVAVDANPQERVGPVQEQFERYLENRAHPIEEQSAEMLETTLQVLVWLDGVLPSLPSLDAVRNRLEWLRFISPFEALAGDNVFQGRKREMDGLRRYIGVVPPESLIRRLTDKAFGWARPRQQPALSVFGPGGIGKSALIARF